MDLLQKPLFFKTAPYLAFLLLELFVDVTKCASQAEINSHLELGKQFLARGQLSDALSHYHAAVEGDPNNYLTYFKRGTVYLALGKAKNALSDLDRVLDLKPDFVAARISRGNIHLKQADYDLAHLDFYNVIQVDPYNAEANDLIRRIEPAQEQRRLAEYHYARDDFPSAINALNDVIEISPWAAKMYEFRAKMHLENNDQLSAVSDYRIATKLQSDNTEGYFTLATLLYQLGHVSDALKSIRECLKLDPEHKDCFPFYKKIKKIDKFVTEAEAALEENKFAECIAQAERILKNEKEVHMIIFEGKKLLCNCYTKDEQTAEALAACTDALEILQDAGVYCDRADAYLQSEQYDDAVRDFQAALDIDQSYERAKEGKEKARKMQAQAEKRDYYKILEVKRSATKKEIVKAYRKMAQKWHPDNYQNDEKMKKIAEKKFIDIAAAKEVLTDEEKRKQFDMGDDPLDPESGRNGPRNFHHNFHHFHGSPFQFQFHFT